MGGWTLFFVLLLPLTVRSDREVTFEKTLGKKSDVTPLCSNTTEGGIKMIVCHINTERSAEPCVLSPRFGQDPESNCDSRFTFMTENETLFLHLTNLTQQDSGNVSCECAHADGTNKVHLRRTVEGDEEVEEYEEHGSLIQIHIPSALIGASVLMTLGAIVAFICKMTRSGVCSTSATSGLSVNEAPDAADQADAEHLYISLQQPTNDIYESLPSRNHQCDTDTTSRSASIVETVHSDDQEIDGKDTDSSLFVYENNEG